MKTLRRAALVAALATGLSLTALAQQGPGPGGPGGPQGPQQGPPPDAVLKEALGFSDAQLQQLQTLLQARGTAMQALQTQIAEAEKAVQTALSATTPDPTAVGTAVIAVKNLRGKGAEIDTAFRGAFEALLTSDQKAKVEAAKGVQAALAIGETLRRLGAV